MVDNSTKNLRILNLMDRQHLNLCAWMNEQQFAAWLTLPRKTCALSNGWMSTTERARMVEREQTAAWLTLSKKNCALLNWMSTQYPNTCGCLRCTTLGCDRWLLWPPTRLPEIPLLRVDWWIAAPRHTTTPLLRRAYKGPDSAYMAPLVTWLECALSILGFNTWINMEHMQLDA